MDSDEALFERLIAGDLGAFDRLYDRFERPLFGFIRAQLGDASEAEDVLHEAFMAVLRERQRPSSIRSFRSWLFGVAANLCSNRIRSRKRAGRALETERAFAAPSSDQAEELEAARRSQKLEHAVERLPRALGEIYRLRATGLSYAEMAEVLGLPLGTVKSRMHEMVERLRREVLS